MVSPNPLVGAVIVNKGRAIGEGWHRKYGDNHAEVEAFTSVRNEDRHLIPDSVLYVNLEPCNHYGNTPPCSIRIHEEGIRKVVIGSVDPDPRVAGEGIAYLNLKGIDVVAGVEKEEAEFLNRFFYTFHQKNRPYVILKWAESEDGYLSQKGKRTKISGTEAQIEVHNWRRKVDAILVGVQTALIDDPQLTDRWHGGENPLRIVIDEEGDIGGEQILMTDDLPTTIFSRAIPNVGLSNNKEWVQIHDTDDFIVSILEYLSEKGMNSLLVEGGQFTLKRWMQSGIWDEARYIRSSLFLNDGIKAPIVRGQLYDRYHAGSDVVTCILNEASVAKS